MPPLTDLFALFCIDLVLCAGLLRSLARWPRVARWSALCLTLLLWIPAGAAQLPLLAYIRGVSSDLSVTLVAVAVLGAWHRLKGENGMPKRERHAVSLTIACAAVLLYPTALGWGDWDAYRAGWGSPGMLAAMLVLVMACWLRGLRLLPSLIALALLGWAFGVLESANLWDYLIDPWLSLAAVFGVLKALACWLHDKTVRPAVRVS